jgi:hypothetical protein
MPSKRRRAARMLATGVLCVVALNVGFAVLLDHGPQRLRDPEYGKRLSRLQDRVVENPDRPLVLVLGSSRTAMGLRPGVLEDRSGPMLFNFSMAGSGPVMELMAFRRAIADGVKPAAVLIEYWPAFLREDSGYAEDARIDPARLRPRDIPLVREFFRDPDGTERVMRRQRLNPWYEHRRSLLNQVAPRWLPTTQRTEAIWDKIDDWGWLPGHDVVSDTQRESAFKGTIEYYGPLFQAYEVSPVADRALRQLIAEVRERGLPLALVYLPESTRFRTLMPPVAATLADTHLRGLCAELALPLIDMRTWAPDDKLPDGFHLMQDGAAEFTKKLAPKVAETFPQIR